MIANLFQDGNNWRSAALVSPPPFFTEEFGYSFSTDSAAVGDTQIQFIGDFTLLPGDYTATVSVTSNPLEQSLFMVLVMDVAPFTIILPMGTELGAYTQTFTIPTGVTMLSFFVQKQNGLVYTNPNYLGAVLQPIPAGFDQPVLVNGGNSDYNRDLCYNAPVDYDSGRFVDPRAQTLAQLRTRIIVRLGYSAQSASPPPGMAQLVDDFLNDANQQLFERYPVMRLSRWWTWQTEVGQRYYDVPIDCTDFLDLRHVEGAWLQDDEAWFPLVAGINPLLFNQVMLSLPQYYELRSTIELWPVPDKATYRVHLKGQAGVTPMVADDDFPAVDSEAVFLHALANAKSHYGQPDAARYDRQLEIYIGRLTAGSHYSKRYIPGESPAVGIPLPIRQVPGG